MKKAVDSEFGARLREAFGDASNTEIARLLEVTNPAVTNYMTDRLPSAEMLLKISGLTNCSIDWLLTGLGEKQLSRKVVRFISAEETQALQNFDSYFSKEDQIELAEIADEEDQWFKAKLWFTKWFEELLSKSDRQVIQDMADSGGISFGEMVGHLIREALAMKGIGEMPDTFPVPVFQMSEELEDRVFRHLDSLPEPTRQAETKKLIGALVTRAATH